MASFLERWEREKKRLEKNDWLTYQWEDLSQVLDPIKKAWKNSPTRIV